MARLIAPARMRGFRHVVATMGVALLSAGGVVPLPLRAQQPPPEQRLRQQQDELDKLRKERADLEARMTALQRSARSLTEEVNNLEAQRQTTLRLAAALDRQLETINKEVAKAGSGLSGAERELDTKRGALRRRMVEIYKRGSLYDVEAMLSAQSFAGLVARYKYLHELALNDRNLVRRVEGLRDQIITQRMLLVRLQDELRRNRQEKDREASRLADLESRRQRNLMAVQLTAQRTRERLQQLTRDESRIANAISALETARRRAEMAPNARPAAPSTIRTSDLGKLDWPVDGAILYRFGRVVNPNNTTTRWNGIGIGAAVGTAVKTISAGEVVLADNVGTYGPTVIVQHGGGDYSVYGSLQNIGVRRGQQVNKGQVIGTVGDTDPELPPHLHFEIRPKGRAIDPLEYLRARR
ncbi:peptidoglycan DD-metalloendopeptidase family protein [Gemmatimonas sp.]|uniref:murein hydrolase activator EnvC family protein n=2 Tax=Gemmatimonas sp. TaxID=1962908 RepID=UPI0025C02BD5|nr:peptidoglycan DD-metalloendopeptidase family protein [Gemmatimonas sp.]MCA2982185.1 peptidoglycan DD-metalloendopeptidase family protein [Gemmatimonas sp.]